MNAFVKFGAEIWRDYVTAGVPGSGAWDVVKADMRAWMAAVEDDIDAETYLTAAWSAASVTYSAGQVVWHSGVDYIAIGGHTSSAATEPGVGVDWEDVWAVFGQDLNPSGSALLPGIAFGANPTTGLFGLGPGSDVLGIAAGGVAGAFISSAGIIVPQSKSLAFQDTDGSHNLLIGFGSDLTENRTLSLITGDTNRIINISAADLVLSAFGATLIDDADGSAARATLGATTVGDAVFIAANAAAARSAIGAVIGTDVQAFDATLQSLSALGTAADRVAYTTGVDTWAETALTSFARTLLDDADAGGILTTLGVSAFIQTLLDDAAASNARTTLGVAIGTDVQAWDADLDALAGVSSSGLLARTGAGTAAARSIAGTANEIDVANGDGVSGNPTLSLPSALTFTGKTVTGGTFSGIAASGTFDVSQAMLWSGFITPTTLSGDVDDYAPAGFSTASTLRINGGANDRNITGLAGGAEGRIIVIHNIGATNNITLVDGSASSSAANRFLFGANATVAVDQTAVLRYDGQSSRWRLLAAPGSGGGGGSGTVTSVSAGDGLTTGGGAITSSGTISLDVNGLSEETSIDGAADFLPVYDATAAAHRKATPANLKRSGGLQLLASGTVSDAAMLDIDLTGFTGYRGLKLLLTGLLPATDNVDLYMLFSTDGGSSFLNSAYNWTSRTEFDNGTAVSGGASSQAQILIGSSSSSGQLSNVSSHGMNVEVEMWNQASVAFFPRIMFRGSIFSDLDFGTYVHGQGMNEAANDCNAVRFIPSSGNIAACDYAVYGYS